MIVLFLEKGFLWIEIRVKNYLFKINLGLLFIINKVVFIMNKMVNRNL